MFSIPDEIRNAVAEAFDDVFTTTSKQCILYYPVVDTGRIVSSDGIGAKPTHVWRHGGPNFGGGLTPLANPQNVVQVENSENIRMTMEWRINKFVYDGGINLRERAFGSVLQTRFMAADLQKVLRAEYVIVESILSPAATWKFRLAADPADMFGFVQGRYYIALWEKIP